MRVRRRLPLCACLVLVLAAVGCGARQAAAPSPPAAVVEPVALTPWPSAADYGTIQAVAAARDRALFEETNWRRKSFTAMLALRMLLTVRMRAGACAVYVTSLYGNLRDLLDAYPGEDWRPLVVLVRRQPRLARVCRRPANRLGA